MHCSGTVVATCSGQRSIPDVEASDSSSNDDGSSGGPSDDEDGDPTNIGDSDDEQSPTCSIKPTGRTLDNSIKVWSL